ncbi:MAG TPA: hypothetical protein DCY13_05085 [Verrucomicrobiales bacterium]|nr:hypothetical protein [Verrucomicrobiales bacterium]
MNRSSINMLPVVRRPRLPAVALVAAGATILFADAASAENIQFNRDIRPLLADNCLACHGPDPGSRKAGLRLDTRGGLFEPTDKRGPTVVAGDLDKSELWYRVTTDDEDDLMPPPDSHKKLDARQKDLLKQWILAGAPWEDHWAFIAPTRPAIPEMDKSSATLRTPIDAFVAAKLAPKALKMNPEADRRSLARRLALDLTGLPPEPGIVAAFVEDSSPDAYEKLVDQFLDSPHWGEHRGRYWLDAARYADTHGLHFDNYREMWPYRDWVIRAFNRNQPYDQFVIEQLAGDLLENPTDEQLVATGFQRCNITTNEGGTIEKENLAIYANDRVTTTGWVFLGLTSNCAACHDHKFDPFTQKDFYAMEAFYRNTTQSGFDKNWREGDGAIVVPRGADKERWAALPQDLRQAEIIERLRQQYTDDAFASWKERPAKQGQADPAPMLGDEIVRVALNRRGTNLNAVLNGSASMVTASAEMAWRDDGPLGPAPVFNKDHTLELGDAGRLEQREPFSFAAWVWLPEDFKGEGAILARMLGSEGNNRGWDFFVNKKQFGVHVVHRWSNVAMKARTDDVLEFGSWQHLAVTYSGLSRADDVKLYLNGRLVATRGDQNRLEYEINVDVPLRIGRRESGSELDDVAVQDLRLYRRQLDAREIQALAIGPRVRELLEKPAAPSPKPEKPVLADTATDEEKKAAEEKHKQALAAWELAEHQRASLRAYFELTQFEPTRQAARERFALAAEQARIRARSPMTHIQKEKPGGQAMAKILMRGQYDKEGEEVSANTPKFLPPMPESAPKNRLGLAQWIVSPENPLAARVAVNRFWQELFGVGIVATTEDFGVVGEPPVNQALLDWLAVDFVEHGWDVKRLFKQMVMSHAYRQDATVTPEKLEKDEENRLLSRGPRFRMDAEMVRDYALATSDLLVPKIGGPSVRPYQPEGVWEAVAMPESNTRHYSQDSGEALYRRSMYTFWKRAAPPATMDVFNAPSREVCAVRRERTNTPLQALATLNDPTFVEAARRLAEHALGAAHGSEEGAVDEMAKRVLLRPLRDKERKIVLNTLKEMQAYYAGNPEAANQLLTIGASEPSANIPPTKLAPLSMIANQLLNLDEVLNK